MAGYPLHWDQKIRSGNQLRVAALAHALRTSMQWRPRGPSRNPAVSLPIALSTNDVQRPLRARCYHFWHWAGTRNFTELGGQPRHQSEKSRGFRLRVPRHHNVSSKKVVNAASPVVALFDPKRTFRPGPDRQRSGALLNWPEHGGGGSWCVGSTGPVCVLSAASKDKTI